MAPIRAKTHGTFRLQERAFPTLVVGLFKRDFKVTSEKNGSLKESARTSVGVRIGPFFISLGKSN